MSTESQTLFEQGKQLLDEEKNTEAVSAFAKAVSIEPNNSEYRAWFAQALITNQQYDEAVSQGSFAVQFDPQNAKGFRQRGFANFYLEKYEDAVKDLSQAILIDKDEENIANALLQRGSSYYELKKYESAIQDFTRVIEHKANSYLYIQRGYCYYNLKNYKSAIIDFTNAIGLEPTNVNAYYWRANSYFFTNELENSLLDDARYHDIGGNIDLISKNDIRGDDYLLFLDTINTHLSKTFLPILSKRKETIVRIFPIWIILWGHYKQQYMVNGGSFEREVGTYGQGYVCLTNQNVYICSLGSLCNNVKKVVKNPLSFLLGMIERYEYSKTDQLWSINNQDVKGTQIKTDDSLKKDFILLRTDDTNWDLNPFFSDEKERLFTALNMARMGKFNNIWPSKKTSTPSSSEIMDLIKKLSELRNQDAITEAEFENKKKDLLSRL